MLLFPEKDSKISSLIEYLILLTLSKEGRLRGVDIIKRLAEQFENWKPQSGTIYPALNRLVKKELLTLEDKFYRINQVGKEILETYMKTYINTIIFIENIFDYSRTLMNQLDIMKFEQIWLEKHLPNLNLLIEELPMLRATLSEGESSEVFVSLRNIRTILNNTLQVIDKQIEAIKDEEKIVRVKIK
ncbi:MAG: PadR family transcriptional regulator [Candidatus Helarchaeota archaeon]